MNTLNIDYGKGLAFALASALAVTLQIMLGPLLVSIYPKMIVSGALSASGIALALFYLSHVLAEGKKITLFLALASAYYFAYEALVAFEVSELPKVLETLFGFRNEITFFLFGALILRRPLAGLFFAVFVYVFNVNGVATLAMGFASGYDFILSVGQGMLSAPFGPLSMFLVLFSGLLLKRFVFGLVCEGRLTEFFRSKVFRMENLKLWEFLVIFQAFQLTAFVAVWNYLDRDLPLVGRFFGHSDFVWHGIEILLVGACVSVFYIIFSRQFVLSYFAGRGAAPGFALWFFLFPVLGVLVAGVLSFVARAERIGDEEMIDELRKPKKYVKFLGILSVLNCLSGAAVCQFFGMTEYALVLAVLAFCYGLFFFAGKKVREMVYALLMVASVASVLYILLLPDVAYIIPGGQETGLLQALTSIIFLYVTRAAVLPEKLELAKSA
ncbi:hypothetical protein FUAX_34090 [Fulvitalea axinellae]|uniref:Uncharacterized protein n=1 Tax=Fulvitalea axinellae TaxID=1182444 RepID=A0AAU9CSI6_9BACT|nr:hypothetical protein FUAX_34090 [Fulvitalea axinellae]